MSTESFVNTKPKIRVIPAKPRAEMLGITNADGRLPKLRVAAYARVSTDHEEQESSYEAQVRHFTQLIQSHEDWELAGIFADPGLSGKNVKRPEFQRMMKLCDNGDVDKIITKSVSRFARNTLDCVQTVRKLKENGIGVYFEKESLDTLQASSEFVLTIMASLAEEESRSISNNIRWSVKKRFENGKVMISTKHFLGYTKDENGNLVIVPEEAVVVRRIYSEFLDGYSLQEIAEGLMRDGILSPSGKDRWHASTIKSILQNEKYKGDCHLQKTYLPDFLSARRVKNEGQAESFYVENDHAAIISQETFELVQQHMKERKSLRGATVTGHSKYSGKYPFSGMVFCGECGEAYRRHQQYSKNNKYYIWVCKRHENTGKQNCTAKPIKEDRLEKAFIGALNNLLRNKESILERLGLTAVTQISDSCENDIAEIEREIRARQIEIGNLLFQKNGGEITETEYAVQLRKLQIRIDELNLKKGETLTEQSNVQLAEYRVAAVKSLLDTGKILDEFDSVIFKTLVKRIIVRNHAEIEIEFECGIKVIQTLD